MSRQDIAEKTDFDAAVDELQPGTLLLHGQYKITRFLQNGGFGITYLAQDSLDRKVVIKECFPGGFCRRTNTIVSARSRAHKRELQSIIRLFVQEAHNLAKLVHPNIVGVHQVFEDNDTAYMAIDFIDGKDLLDIVEDPSVTLKPAQIVGITRKLLSAIGFVHDHGVLHRDISPDNVLLKKDGEPILIDFGAARAHASNTNRALSALRVVKDGYSPQEFYISGSDQGPWSDLYALAASLYHVIRGAAPVNGQARLAALAEGRDDPYEPLAGSLDGYPANFLEAIDKAMSTLPKNRLQSAGEWLAMLDGNAAGTGAVDDDPLLAISRMLREDEETRKHEAETRKKAAREATKQAATKRAAEMPKSPPPEQWNAAFADEDDAPDTGVPPHRSKGRLLLATLVMVLFIVAGVVGYGMMGNDTTAPVLRPDVQADATVAGVPADTPAADGAQTGSPVGETDIAAPVLPETTGTATTEAIAAPVLPETIETVTTEAIAAAEPPEIGQITPIPETEIETAEVAAAIAAAEAVAEAIADADIPVITPDEADAETAEADGEAVAAISDAPPPRPSEETRQEIAAAAIDATTDTAATDAEGEAVTETAPVGPLAQNQISFSHWDVDLPFEVSSRRVRNSNIAFINEVMPWADLKISGNWISEGTMIYTINDTPLDGRQSFATQVLNNLKVDPDGFTRLAVRFKSDGSDRFERGLLAVPVLRQVGFANDLIAEIKCDAKSGTWVTTISNATATGGALQPGDILISESASGVALDGPDALDKALGALVAMNEPVASFRIERDGAIMSAELPLAIRDNP